jgi:hypothetical protein
MAVNLWTNIDNSEYSNNKELYQNHILEQYKMYVEMVDRISSRRNLTNIFFLTLNVLTPIKQEYYSKFRLLIMRLIFSLKLSVYPGSIFPLV